MSQQRAAETQNAEAAAKRAASEAGLSARKDHPITRLQQAIGNHSVQRLIQTATAFDETDSQQDAPLIGDIVNAGLNSTGHGLDAETLAFMEAGFGWDFSRVKVHTDSSAVQSADAVSAKAYTVGQDIVFGEGQYSPGSSEGMRLLAHELTHVTQQQGMPAAGGDLTISEPSDQPEHEAEQTANDVMSAQERGITGAETWSSMTGDPGSATVQRDDDDSWLGGLGNMVSNAGSAIASGVGSVVDTGASLASDAGSAIASGVGSVVDTGENLVSDAGSAISSGVGSVVNTGESLASDAGSAIASGASDLWHAGSDVASDIYGDMKSAGKAVRGATQAVEGGIGDLASMSKEGWNDLAESAKGIPVLEQLASGAAWVGGGAADVTSGVLKGATGLVGSVVGMAADPVDAAIGIENLAEHIPIVPGMPNPLQVAHGLYNVVANGADIGEEANRVLNPLEVMKGDADFAKNLALGIANPYIDAYHRGNYGEMAGRGIFDVGMLLTGAGEAGAAAEGTEALSAVGKVAEGSEALGTVAEGTEATSAIAEGSEATKAGQELSEGLEAGPKVPEETPIPSEPPPGYPEEQWGQPTKPVTPDEHVYEIPSEPTIPDQGPYRTPGVRGAGEGVAESTASEAGTATKEAESTVEKSLDSTESATEQAGASEEAAVNQEAGSSGGSGGESTSDAGRTVEEVQAGRNARLRAQSNYRDVRLEQLKEEVTGIRSEDTKMLEEDRGLDVPQEIAEGETTLGEAQVNVHHKQMLSEAPELASEPENLELLDAQGGGSAHAAGAHGNQYATPRAGVPADASFDENLGMSADKRRLVDSETRERVPGLGETAEDEGNITARPKDQTLEEILEEQAEHNWRETENEFEND